MSKLTKNIISFVFILAIFSLMLLARPVFATITVPTGIDELGTGDITTTAESIINTILGLLGLVALVIILIGGFKWMTSGGNEEKVGEAKKLLGAGIIGIIIVLAAYAIAKFVIESAQTS